MYAVAEKVNT